MLLHRNPEAARIAVQTPGGTFTALRAFRNAQRSARSHVVAQVTVQQSQLSRLTRGRAVRRPAVHGSTACPGARDGAQCLPGGP
jgi:hypothetical protein